ncbi:MAG: PHP domain-containing protein [Clostridia bacterium]|nr:PHP domain-containing protein [Clostridia bacterium]
MTNRLPKIDLHMHTTVSDGTDTPEALLARVKAAGIGLFSVTDHDAVEGCRRVLAARTADDPAFVTGVELSCRDEEGQYHILGYGYDPDAEAINAIVRQGHDFRMKKLLKRLAFLKERFGFAFSEEEVDTLMHTDNPGKPHIANLMVSKGYAKDRNEAIRTYLNQAHYAEEYVRPEDAIRAISESGGIPVLAHPPFGNGNQLILGNDLRARVKKLMGFGLSGLEGFYSGYSEKLRNEVLALAEAFDLYVTAGSDYHGSNKPVGLGDTGMDNTARIPNGMTAFLQAIKQRKSEEIE